MLGTSYGSHQVDHPEEPHEPVLDPDPDVNPAKRLRVSDINISRYEEEFVELKEIASGSFGKVKVARHCLDGMLYAIKVKLLLDFYPKKVYVTKKLMLL